MKNNSLYKKCKREVAKIIAHEIPYNFFFLREDFNTVSNIPSIYDAYEDFAEDCIYAKLNKCQSIKIIDDYEIIYIDITVKKINGEFDFKFKIKSKEVKNMGPSFIFTVFNPSKMTELEMYLNKINEVVKAFNLVK